VDLWLRGFLGLAFAIWLVHILLLLLQWPPAAYRAVLPIWRKANRPAAKVALRRLAAAAEKTGGWADGLQLRHEIVGLQLKRPDGGLFGDLSAYGLVLVAAGRYPEAKQIFNTVIDIGDRAKHQVSIGLAQFGLSWCIGAAEGPTQDVSALSDIAISNLEAGGAAPGIRSWALRFRAGLHGMGGEIDAADQTINKARQVDPSKENAAMSALALATMRVWQDRLPDAERELEAARAMAKDMPPAATFIRGTEAELCLARGDKQRAATLLNDVIEERKAGVGPNGIGWPEVMMAMVEVESGQSRLAANRVIAAQPNILDVETRYQEQRLLGRLARDGIIVQPLPAEPEVESNLPELAATAAGQAPAPLRGLRAYLDRVFAWTIAALLVLAFLGTATGLTPKVMATWPFVGFVVIGGGIAAFANAFLQRPRSGSSLLSLGSLGCLSLVGGTLAGIGGVYVSQQVLHLDSAKLAGPLFALILVGMSLPPLIYLRRNATR
jgi:tetratricopeptide (TPR) repeat protein